MSYTGFYSATLTPTLINFVARLQQKHEDVTCKSVTDVTDIKPMGYTELQAKVTKLTTAINSLITNANTTNAKVNLPTDEVKRIGALATTMRVTSDEVKQIYALTT